MKKNIPLFLLRIAFGWFFLYSGITKVLNPEWTSAGLLTHANTFPGMYEWFASAANIGWVDFMNQWGQVLIGLSLVTGLLTRISSFFAILLMLLYYFPSLDFPHAGDHGYIIDDHILYALALAVLITKRAGRYIGLDYLLEKKVKGWWV